ncbi:MAG: hypothetical protein ACI311_04895 [Bacilli bacterium]
MEKGNYYFNEKVGYVLLEEFDDKFVSIFCVANNKKYSFLDKNILNEFDEKIFVSKYMIDFYTKNHQFSSNELDIYFSKFSRIIENDATKEECENIKRDDTNSSSNIIESEVVEEKVIDENSNDNGPFSKESIKKFVKDTAKDVADSLKETGKFIKDIFDKL